MMTKEKIVAAAKHMNTWRKIYNSMCMNCKTKLMRVKSDVKNVGTEIVTDRINHFMSDNLCGSCKQKVNEVLKK